MGSAVVTADNILFYSIVAAVVPVALYVGLIYWADWYEKEPWWLLSAAFLWGAVPAALLAFLFNSLVSLPFYYLFPERAADLVSSGAVAPVVEEIVKALVLFLILIVRRQELDSPLDGIIYGAMVGMGFAMVENVLYYVANFRENGPDGWNSLVLIRGGVFGLNHALYTGLTGLGIALARASRSRWVQLGAPLLGLGAAILLHSLHNVSMMGGTPFSFLAGLTFGWGGVWLTVGIIILALYQERRWIRRYLVDEVERGTLTSDEYHVASSAAGRGRYRLGLLLNGSVDAYLRSGRRFRLFSELAYRKRHYAYFNDETTLRAIDELRRQIDHG